MRIEVRLTGSGGQGVVLAATILAEAAGVYAGRVVHQTQFYAPMIVSGPVYADVIVSDNEKAFPWVTEPHVLIALTQGAFRRFLPSLRNGGLILFEPSLVTVISSDAASGKVFPVPAMDIAQKVGSQKSANMVCLGALVATTNIITMEHLEKAVGSRSPERFRELNQMAALRGWEYAQGLREACPHVVLNQ